MPEPKRTVLTPYIQLARIGRFPMGTLFVYWPAAWAAVMAAYSVYLPLYKLLWNLVGLGAACILVNTTICTLNDIADRKIDAQVERTKKRPLPSGAVSLGAALIFLLAQVMACLTMVRVWARSDVLPYCLVTLFPLHGLYPFMKRVTYWPQVWLGLAAASGGAVAWQHITGVVRWDVIAPYIAGLVCRVVYFDTVYACQDRKDDKKLGLGSTAVLFGDFLKPILAFFALSFVAALAYVGYQNHQGAIYYLVSVGSAAIHLTWQLATVDFDDKSSCMTTFMSNEHMGYFIFAGMMLDYAKRVGLLTTPVIA